jgi:SAM-dependent methyltransferase
MSDSYGALLPALFDDAATFGWRAGMNAVTRALLGHCRGSTLELGCGRGDLLGELAASGADGPLAGVELHPQAFGATPRLDYHLVRGDAQQLPYTAASFETILALDLLDQRGIKPAILLAECRRVLRPTGRLVVRVSAHPGLYGPHDVAFNTARRFRRCELVGMLSMAGFEIERLTYADGLLIMPVAMVRLLQRSGLMPFSAQIYRARWSNRLISAALQQEANLLRRHNLPLGLSLLTVAQRR